MPLPWIIPGLAGTMTSKAVIWRIVIQSSWITSLPKIMLVAPAST